jgi:hypothetical protein
MKLLVVIPDISQLMKRSIVLLFLVFHLLGYAQRSGRNPRTSPSTTGYTFNSQPSSPGRYYSMLLTNKDSSPILLRLGLTKRIDDNDTLTLTRIISCQNSAAGLSYDLDYPAVLESSCVRWYSFQLINPGDSIYFTVKLNNLAEPDTAKLYCCFTNEITNEDKVLYTDPTKIYIRGETGRDFKTDRIDLYKTGLNVISLHYE